MANLTISLDENLVKQARIKAIQEGTDPTAINDSVIVVEFDNGVRQIMKGKL